MEDAKNYGCDGLLGIHWRTKQTAPQITAMAQKSWNMSMTSAEFWDSWATAQFGTVAGKGAASLFSRIESYNLPRPVNWLGGPGGWQSDSKQCGLDNTTYAFVAEFENLLAAATDPGDNDRLLYWVNTFRYMRNIARTECAWSEYDAAFAKAAAAPTAAGKAKLAEQIVLPARVALLNAA